MGLKLICLGSGYLCPFLVHVWNRNFQGPTGNSKQQGLWRSEFHKGKLSGGMGCCHCGLRISFPPSTNPPLFVPACCQVLFVNKKDRSLRQCLDCRGLNQIIIKDKYPFRSMEPPISLSWISAPHSHQRGRWVENSLQDPNWPLWISNHALWTLQQSSLFPSTQTIFFMISLMSLFWIILFGWRSSILSP